MTRITINPNEYQQRVLDRWFADWQKFNAYVERKQIHTEHTKSNMKFWCSYVRKYFFDITTPAVYQRSNLLLDSYAATFVAYPQHVNSTAAMSSIVLTNRIHGTDVYPPCLLKWQQDLGAIWLPVLGKVKLEDDMVLPSTPAAYVVIERHVVKERNANKMDSIVQYAIGIEV